METKSEIHIEKDFKEKSILVSREFSAPLKKVWRAYTESEVLDQWWAPSPWHVETKVMNFSIGGYWLYAMVNPEGEKHWSRMNYIAIEPHKSLSIRDAFCDENGNINKDLPVSKGKISFTSTQHGTLVEFKMIYQKESDLQQMIDMGFEQGITSCLDQLENLFNKKLI